MLGVLYLHVFAKFIRKVTVTFFLNKICVIIIFNLYKIQLISSLKFMIRAKGHYMVWKINSINLNYIIIPIIPVVHIYLRREKYTNMFQKFLSVN